MVDYLTTPALALLPVLGAYAGAAVAEAITVWRTPTFALYTGAGGSVGASPSASVTSASVPQALINQLLPEVVIWDLEKQGFAADPAAAEPCSAAINRAWRDTAPHLPEEASSARRADRSTGDRAPASQFGGPV